MSVTQITRSRSSRSYSLSRPHPSFNYDILPTDDQLDALAAVRLSEHVSEEAFRVLRSAVLNMVESRRHRAMVAELMREAVEIMSAARRDCLPSSAAEMHRWMLQAHAVLSDLDKE